MTYEVRKNGYLISTDPALIDLAAVHAFLSQRSYWATGIARERLEEAIDHSLPFGLYKEGRQIGFCRVISDFVTFAYLADVYVDEAQRGQGLSKWLLEAVLAHPQLQRLRRWMLGTRDAHGLYGQFGFIPLEEPQRWMELSDPNAYAPAQERAS